MYIDRLNKDYILYDGKIEEFRCSFLTKEIVLELKVRKKSKKRFIPCKIRLTFINVIDFYISEDFLTNGNYSDVIIKELEENKIYVSFDPYDNSGNLNLEDNWVIKAHQLNFIDIT